MWPPPGLSPRSVWTTWQLWCCTTQATIYQTILHTISSNHMQKSPNVILLYRNQLILIPILLNPDWLLKACDMMFVSLQFLAEMISSTTFSMSHLNNLHADITFGCLTQCAPSVKGSCCDLRQHECKPHNRGLNNKCYDDCMCEEGEWGNNEGDRLSGGTWWNPDAGSEKTHIYSWSKRAKTPQPISHGMTGNGWCIYTHQGWWGKVGTGVQVGGVRRSGDGGNRLLQVGREWLDLIIYTAIICCWFIRGFLQQQKESIF